MKLAKKLERGKLWPICLPDNTNEYKDHTAIVAGWGVIEPKIVRVRFIHKISKSAMAKP